MALRSFRVENERALRLATCEQAPSVMVVAGPNGAGKSTLLYALQRRVGTDLDGDTRIIYQPPHRAIRRQQVQRRWLGGQYRPLAEIFAQESVGGFEGLQIPFPSRSPDNVDEAGSVLKYTLGRLENRRQTGLATLVDRQSARSEDVRTSDLPDVFEPVRRLTSRLLPHLTFKRIDFTNEDNIRCVFDRTDDLGTTELDLDDLSSGEKAIFILFLPLIESDITGRLNLLFQSGDSDGGQLADRVFLIDETEQHLHPELQARLLGYMREEAARNIVQFVVTTHSPTLVDQAFDDELYVLSYAAADGRNQLKRVASTAERLSALKALTGSTFVVTTGRTIICLEGERQSRDGPTDLALLQTLHPASSRYTFVPVGGKGNVIRVVTELRSELAAESLDIAVGGIVDRDRTVSPDAAGIVRWPACMIENLLLDADVAAAVISDAKGEGVSTEAVTQYLTDEAQSRRDDEVSLRVMEALGPKTVRLKGATLEAVRESIADASASIDRTDEQINKALAEATTAVDTALEDGSFTNVFRGKPLLKGIYRRAGLESPGLSYEQFAYGIAQRLADAGTLTETIDQVFEALSSSLEVEDQVSADAEMPDL
jgi:energy-coupling factor transporter ATP-binding protein EcfA2